MVKMNKINFLFGVLVLTFAFGILGSSVWGATRLVSTITPTPIPLPTPTPEPKIDYFLPYPGILPDNPFYKIKMIRDRIVLVLTTDPVKKTEKLLLYADKRLGAGRALVEGNKVELGISTITKGEKYLEQAITQAEKVKKSGKEVSQLYDRLITASMKHGEVLEEIANMVSDSLRPSLLEAQKKTIDNLILLSE